MLKLYIIEKDLSWRRFLNKALDDIYTVRFLSADVDPYQELKSSHYDLVLLDTETTPHDPYDILKWIKTALPYTTVIMTSPMERAEDIVTAVKQGAYDFISKPYSAERIRLTVEQALENRNLKNELDYLRREQEIVYRFDQVIAQSPVMKGVIKTLEKFAATDTTILLTGETGTGKSFLSGTIHFNSRRRAKPFININCANIPETLLESELFGHEKGAFTGADKLRVGRFEQAHGGTLFLDEIGEMSLALQSKLLRVLEEKSFERLGGNKTIQSDVRVIAATNRSLEQQIASAKFREDLYYRINVLSVMLPPLRDRKECIEPLCRTLLEKICRSLRKKISGFSDAVMQNIMVYPWPGNIRQLANTIERAVILEEEDMIQPHNMSLPKAHQKAENTAGRISAADSLAEQEKQQILSALEESLWIQKDAAGRLGISPRALNYKIKKFGISHPRWRKNRCKSGG